jgi:hypothetical protein
MKMTQPLRMRTKYLEICRYRSCRRLIVIPSHYQRNIVNTYFLLNRNPTVQEIILQHGEMGVYAIIEEVRHCPREDRIKTNGIV